MHSQSFGLRLLAVFVLLSIAETPGLQKETGRQQNWPKTKVLTPNYKLSSIDEVCTRSFNATGNSSSTGSADPTGARSAEPTGDGAPELHALRGAHSRSAPVWIAEGAKSLAAPLVGEATAFPG